MRAQRPQIKFESYNSRNTRHPSDNRRLLVKTPALNILLSSHCNTSANKAADRRRPVRAVAPGSKSSFSRFIARRGKKVICNVRNARTVLTNRTVAESEGTNVVSKHFLIGKSKAQVKRKSAVQRTTIKRQNTYDCANGGNLLIIVTPRLAEKTSVRKARFGKPSVKASGRNRKVYRN